MTPLARRATAEMLGTAFLIFFGCSAVIMDYFSHYGVFGVAIIHSVILALAISMTMAISGGHINPAVTLGLLSIKRIDPTTAFIYIASQLVGALVGALAVRVVMPTNVGHVIGYGTPVLSSTTTFLRGVTIEAVLTFLLMSAVMGTCVNPRAPKIAGFGVGLTLLPIIMVGAPLTSAVVNPARAFGPAVISGEMTAQAVWWIGPILGAVLAAFFWDKLLLSRDDAEA